MRWHQMESDRAPARCPPRPQRPIRVVARRGSAEGDRGSRLRLGPGRRTARRDARGPEARRPPRHRSAAVARGDGPRHRRARAHQPPARLGAPLPRVRGPARVRAPHRRGAASSTTRSTSTGVARSRRRRKQRCAGSSHTAEALGVRVCLENLCPVYPGRLERLPRPAVGPRPREAARHPGLRDAARRRPCPRGGGLHGRRDR